MPAAFYRLSDGTASSDAVHIQEKVAVVRRSEKLRRNSAVDHAVVVLHAEDQENGEEREHLPASRLASSRVVVMRFVFHEQKSQRSTVPQPLTASTMPQSTHFHSPDAILFLSVIATLFGR